MPKPKKIPMRRCIACGCNKPKSEMIRVVKDKLGEVTLDLTGRKNGRGAYLCHDRACLDKAVKSKALNRAFEMEINDEIIEKLRDSFR
ncbi:YlxR family protein [Peptoniphilus equinus]|uniref:YlxR family protein n=1 Tax=Peptoniphilus equinus TaxID=3016343 RepID=A0ABY7QV56_9FIRM|nr:YlxR family protein [Peptoniphilus equinus]WBW50677.1 YlxR family protein [Peptoniphilus equinus]